MNGRWTRSSYSGASTAPTRAENHEAGLTLIWVASMLVLLLGASAFAVDLGWIYLNGARLQRAADAAALAGVVNLPAFVGEPRTTPSTEPGVTVFRSS